MAVKKKTLKTAKHRSKRGGGVATRGVVYVLSNSAMPGLVKIGRTKTVQGVKSRMSSLYTTGVPVPFKCEFAMQVDDAKEQESKLHRLFKGAQINERREFFEVKPKELSEFLRVCGHGKDVTHTLDTQIKGIKQADVVAEERWAKKQRPKMRLSDLGIPDGAVLVSRKAGFGPEECVVDSAHENLVRFREEVRPFTEATFIILGEPKWSVTSPAYCTNYWEYNGKRLKKLYQEIFP